MKMSRVHSILGGPARIEATDPVATALIKAEITDIRHVIGLGKPEFWATDELIIIVAFDNEDNVVRTNWHALPLFGMQHETLLNRIYRLLGL